MLIATLLLPLLCPPTSTPDAARDPTGWTLFSLYHAHFTGIDWASLPPPPVHDVPELPTLPLWDLDATLARLEDDQSKDAAWLRWAIATAQGRPATAHGRLIAVFASDDLTAGRLAWWRALGSHDRHAQDALLEAYALAAETRTQLYLAAALALGEWTFSCPVAVAIDGACLMPGTAVLVRRDPISIERARHWTKRVRSLRRKLSLDPTDIAEVALLAELDLAAMSEDYEAQLSAHTPGDLDFTVEEYLHESGVPAWERRYEQQLEYAEESRQRFVAFYESSQQCRQILHDHHAELVQIHTDLAARVHLREARLVLAGIADMETETRLDRGFARMSLEDRDWSSRGYNDSVVYLRDHAEELLMHCADPTVTANPDIIEACRSLLDDGDPLAEFACGNEHFDPFGADMRRTLPCAQSTVGMGQAQQGRHRTAQCIGQKGRRDFVARVVALLEQAQQSD